MSQRNQRSIQPQAQKRVKPPLFEHLYDDDTTHVAPPSPLGNLFTDLDAELPSPVDKLLRARQPQKETDRRWQYNEQMVGSTSARTHSDVDDDMRYIDSDVDDEDQYVLRLTTDYTNNARRSARFVARPSSDFNYYERPMLRIPTPSITLGRPVVMLMVAVVSIAILSLSTGRYAQVPQLSRWMMHVSEKIGILPLDPVEPKRPPGDYNLQGAPSITAAQIDAILETFHSPAAGTGRIWYNLGLKYEIDPAFALAFFIHESSAGTNPGWAGIKPEGGTTHNIGNIICAGYSRCYGRFRDYASWEEGINDWYRLIDVEYIKGRGVTTVADIIPIYAPSFENDVQGYINAVTRTVDDWRTQGMPR